MGTETDLNRIRQLAERRDDENWEFRTFLKHFEEDDLDGRVHRILEEVEGQIDCAACMNCCKELRASVDDEDIDRLSQALSISPEGFREQYVEETELGSRVLRGQPCPFLKDDRCSVEANQPEGCREFPHLHKEGFVFRLMGVVSNYGVCPIVFNVYERLKDELDWRPRRRRR